MRRLVLAAAMVHAAAALAGPALAEAGQSAFDHSSFDRVLAAHVIRGGVDYGSVRDDRAELDAYVRQLGEVDSVTFDAWPRSEQIAYLINAYNAYVILGVIDNYPIRRSLRPLAWFRPGNSIWQIRGFFDGIRYRAAGRSLTLDDIEHVWLRDVLNEPRIHFALVCAARSCPPLRPEAYVAHRLDAQLDHQASRFFTNRRVNEFDRTAGVVRLSSILRWFGEDFEVYAPPSGYSGSPAERGALHFAAQFLDATTADWLRGGDYRIEYFDYNWRLNDQRR